MSDLISYDITDGELVDVFSHLGINRDNARHFRGRLRHRLLIDRCTECRRYQYPSRPICQACWSSDLAPTEVSGSGRIHLVIFLHQGPAADDVDYSTPYPVATVELDEQEGLRFTATVVDSPNDEITIGSRVELTWIDRAGVPTPAFRLTGDHS